MRFLFKWMESVFWVVSNIIAPAYVCWLAGRAFVADQNTLGFLFSVFVISIVQVNLIQRRHSNLYKQYLIIIDRVHMLHRISMDRIDQVETVLMDRIEGERSKCSSCEYTWDEECSCCTRAKDGDKK